NNVGQIANGPLAPAVQGYDESITGLEYDVDKARELLAEAGYEDGFSTTIWTNDSRERIDSATNVQAQLAEVGVEIDGEVLEWGAYLDLGVNGGQDMSVLGWSNSTATAETGIYPLLHSENFGYAGNMSCFADDHIDEVIQDARKEMDEEKRH